MSAAPKAMHDQLDTLAPAVDLAKRLGMGAQLILYVDKHGKLGEPKITMSGVSKEKAQT